VKVITKIFEFAASHRLIDPNLSEEENKELFGKCYNPPSHGHSYVMHVTICGPEKNGMIINFVDLKRLVNEAIVDKVDHQFLNDLEMFKGKITTCETIVDVFIPVLQQVIVSFNRDVRLVGLTVYETRTSFCTWKL